MLTLARISPTARWGTAALFVALASVAVACSAPGFDDYEPEIKPPPRDPLLPGDTRGAELPAGSSSGGESSSSGSSGASSSSGGSSGSSGASGGDAGAPDAAADAKPPPSTGRWVQVDGAECVSHCASLGMTNVPSVEGASCTSGENIPQSALDAGITYNKCYPNCSAHLAGQSPKSVGGRCYADGQKRDDDASDRTRGCFCK